MSQEQPMPETGVASRRRVPLRFDQIKRSPALSIIGLPELFGLAGAAVLTILVIFAYFYFYLPAGYRLTSAELELKRLQAQLEASGTALEEGITTNERVKQINNSLRDFEGNRLATQAAGRMSLYTVMNQLIKSNGLRNTAGPSYSSLEPVGTKTQVQPTVTAEKQSNAKWQSIYPGIAVSVTVEGPYQNVRNFVRDLEGSRQFLMINAVELERVTQSGQTQDQSQISPVQPIGPRRNAATTSPLAGGSGTLVSLRLDLAAYFQRSGTMIETP